jgi:hypothetical protein
MTAPAASRIPIATADGRPYVPADAVVALLRAIAETHRDLADQPGCDLRAGADHVDAEADALDCRAIAITHPGSAA